MQIMIEHGINTALMIAAALIITAGLIVNAAIVIGVVLAVVRAALRRGKRQAVPAASGMESYQRQ
jgi:hypothetical protein